LKGKHIASLIADMLPDIERKQGLAFTSSFLEHQFSESELDQFCHDLEQHGQTWGFQPRHEIASQLITLFISKVIGSHSIHGLEHARDAVERAQKGERVVMVGNHLSYGDTNYLQAQLELQGLKNFPLMVMAGPKVYTDPFRRLSSMAFDTLKMAQPPSRASGDAKVSMRELAEITRKVMDDAKHYQSKGRILYFFPEGSRTRSGAIESFIPASARYCDADNTWVYPVGFAGTDGLVGVDSNEIHISKPMVSIGKPLSYSELSPQLPESPSERRKAWMDLLGFAVAAECPNALAGAYGDDAVKAGQVKDWRHLLSQSKSHS
jgi:1-acyl-sn-glycerol-3-phosphate acyltransferase